MAKSEVQKAIDQQKKIATETKNREYAKSIVDAQPIVSSFRLMDADSEAMLRSILDQYDGNENNHVGFRSEALSRPLAESIAVQYEKLKMYGMLSSVINYPNGGIMTISDTAKTYFADKEAALARAEEEKKEQRRIAEIEAATHIHKKYDVFISHASADKEDYVDELNRTVKKLGINIFYDTDVLSWGDKWKQVILDGTADSEFAIIVISKNFFGREWTEKELNEFLGQQNESGQKIVLPLLHGISRRELLDHYPALEEIQYINAADYSKEEISILLAKELIKRYK